MSDVADWKSSGRLFQSRGPAVANERSPTVTHRDGRTLSRLEVDDRRLCMVGGCSKHEAQRRRTPGRLNCLNCGSVLACEL